MDRHEGIAALNDRVRRDLALVAHPTLNWMPQRRTPRGEPLLDVLIVGAEQGGLALAFRLLSERVRNILVVESAPRGHDGAWRTYARMSTLRSPKDYTGPDLGVPGLTCRAWHEARFGAADFDAMHLIPTGHWADYLDWFRDVLELPVVNDHRLVAVEPCATHLVAHLQTANGPRAVLTRKLVLASGQAGTGRWTIPPLIESLPSERYAHCADDIDFESLRGRDIVVVGAGASAADSAVCALEHGAARAASQKEIESWPIV